MSFFFFTFKIPLWSAKLTAFFFWNWWRLSANVSSSLLKWSSGCSNDTFELFNDPFKFKLSPVFKSVCCFSFKFLTFADSSVSDIGLNALWCLTFGAGLFVILIFGLWWCDPVVPVVDADVWRDGNGFNSFVCSRSTVSKLVDVDDVDNDPSAVSTRE